MFVFVQTLKATNIYTWSMTVGTKRAITDFFTVVKKQKSVFVKKSDESIRSIHHEVPKLSNVVTFNKHKWIDSLNAEQKELLQLEISTMDDSWLSVLYQELTKPYFLDLKRFLRQEWSSGKDIFPPKEDIYSWTRLTPISNVKVLILGQDPYHNFNQAHGLAFSVKDPKTRVPPSLVNIYKCLHKEYPDFEIPKNGDLTKWSKEGVLLLNTCLTVRAHNANSHSNRGWEIFTMSVVKKLIEFKNNQLNQGLVIIAWGSPAQKTILKAGKIDWNKNLFLKSVHPSPLSASRGFFDSRHFIQCNNWLYKHYGPSGLIDWALVDGNVIHDIEKLEKIDETGNPQDGANEREVGKADKLQNGVKEEEVGKVDKLDKVDKVDKVDKFNKVGKVGEVDKVGEVGEVGDSGEIRQMSEISGPKKPQDAVKEKETNKTKTVSP